MKIKVNKADLGLFLKTGIVVLSLMAIIFSGIKHIPGAVSVSNHTNAVKQPICSVETDEKVVSLTFDVSNDKDDIENILDTLDKYKVKGTFFITGKWLDNNPEILSQIVDRGHDIANKSNSHKHMDLLNEDQCRQEILTLHNKVKEYTGVEMTMFRPPYGGFDNELIHGASDLGYKTIKWDIDSQDWKDYSEKDIIKQTAENKNLKNGSIILFHTNTKYTASSLEKVIISLENQDYKIQPLSKIIYPDKYTIDSTGRQHSNN